jgi:signal transduction histidine kinase
MDAPRRVLYIEDDPTNYDLVQQLLTDEGFEVLHAPDGFEGVHKAVAEKDHLDLVLVDINMPGMDGFEAATKLKNICGFETIPIIALTCNAFKGDRKRSLAAGCDGFIARPVDNDILVARIKEYAEGKRERIQASEESYYLREHNRKLVNRLESQIGELRFTHGKVHHQNKLASLGEMAAGVAHELNNPLSSISVTLQLLLREAPDGSRQRQQLDRIMNNVTRIQKLAEGLTSFARPSDTKKSAVELPGVLADALLLSEHELHSRGIQARMELAEGLPPVWASDSLLHHVLLNLLKNGAQAISARQIEEGGCGFPCASAPGVLILRARLHDAGTICLEVEDNGTGISNEYQDRLFTPFFTTKPKGQGTGLGLYIVKQIVEDLGGSIVVKSTVGKGTTFQVLLPLYRGPEERE